MSSPKGLFAHGNWSSRPGTSNRIWSDKEAVPESRDVQPMPGFKEKCLGYPHGVDRYVACEPATCNGV